MSTRPINQALDSNFTMNGEEEESNKGSGSKEEVNDATVKLQKYVQALIGKQVRAAMLQTGGPRAQGEGPETKKKVGPRHGSSGQNARGHASCRRHDTAPPSL